MKHQFQTGALLISRLAFLCLFQLASIFATPGGLDTTFAGTGTLRHGFGLNADYGTAMAAQADGKIVAAGNAFGVSNSDFAVIRYNADGTPDTSFGIVGEVITPVGTGHDFATGVGIQLDGKIVVAGYVITQSGSVFALVRYNTDGSLDPSFGNGGKVTTPGTDVANAMLLQADGKIVVVGGDGGFVVARYNTNGALDANFGVNGIARTPVGSGGTANGITIQANGKLVVAGSGGGSFAVVRYNTDGSLDGLFDGDGIATISIGSGAVANAVAIQTSNTQADKIVVAGSAGGDFAIVRYFDNGSLDTSFGFGGIVTTDISSSSDEARAVMIQYSGATGPIRIIVGGYSRLTSTNHDFAVAKYLLNGSLDTSFDGDGKVLTNITSGHFSQDDGNAMMFHFGRIVVAGSGYNGDADFVLVRYNSNGSLDTSFDTDGIRIDDIGNSNAGARGVAIQADGRIVAVGAVDWNSNSRFSAIARYNTDGSLDPSFDFDGRVAGDPFTSFSGGFYSVAIQPDGKIVAAGVLGGNTGNSDLALSRFNTDGSLDFIVATPVGTSVDAGKAVTIQPDGKFVVAGFADSGPGSSGRFDFAVLRYNTNGTLDGSFDADGIVLTDFSTNSDIGNAMAIQSDGKIVVAGRAGSTFAAARYNTDGSLDTSFSFDGKVTTPVSGSSDGGKAVAIQPDGKIVVAGDLAVVRYNTDGSLDTSFDGDGIALTTLAITNGMAIQPDGKIIVAGSDGSNFSVVRCNANGSLDASYGNGGTVTADISGTDIAFGVALDSQGRAVVVGEAGSLFGVARILGNPPPCSYALSPSSQFFTTAGGDGSINLTTLSGCNWSASASEAWITITSADSGTGNGVVDYVVRENFTASARQAVISISGVNQIVVQDGGLGEDCGYFISPAFQSFPASGGGGSINVLSSERCAWQAVASVGWVTITSTNVGIGNGAVSFTVAANPGGGRHATITIGDRLFSIKQKAG